MMSMISVASTGSAQENIYSSIARFLVTRRQTTTLPIICFDRLSTSSMTASEVMTILILFHRSNYRNFKHYYIDFVPYRWKREFPNRVSYNRFVELAQSVLIPLSAYLQTRRVTSCGIAFVDSTPLRVCHNRRIPRHKTFAKIAERGKNAIDWFYGFKLHLIIDDRGELVAFFVTPGNVDDRKALRQMSKYIKGKLFGDKGYISKPLQESLWEQGIELITNTSTGSAQDHVVI